jgi:hypothetical protein
MAGGVYVAVAKRHSSLLLLVVYRVIRRSCQTYILTIVFVAPVLNTRDCGSRIVSITTCELLPWLALIEREFDRLIGEQKCASYTVAFMHAAE